MSSSTQSTGKPSSPAGQRTVGGRLSANARRAWVRARDWAWPDVGRWVASEVAIVVVAALAYGFGLGFKAAVTGAALATAATGLVLLGAFVFALVQVARHPERNPHWQARTNAGGAHLPLNLELWRTGGPDYVYGHRCTVKHPSGVFSTATDESHGQVAWKHWKAFYFFCGGPSSDFPSDTPQPVSGRYEVTWELRFKLDGPWREVVYDRNVTITLPKGQS